MKTTAFFIPALGIGIVAGVLAALCGVGGGIIMVPAFTQSLGLTQKTAVATSLAVIVPTALVGTVRYAREGLIDWRLALWAALGACITAWVASDWLKRLQSESLTRMFALLIIAVGLKMLFWPGTKA